MALHEDQLEANRIDLQTYNTGVLLGLTDAMVLGLTTVGGPTTAGSLQKAILDLPVHEDQKYALVRVNKGSERDRTLATLTDVNIAAADTNTGARALYVAQDARITDTLQRGGVLAGE